MFQGVYYNLSTIDRTGEKLLGRRNLNHYISYGSKGDKFTSTKQKKASKVKRDVLYVLKGLAVVGAVAAAVAGGIFLLNKTGKLSKAISGAKNSVNAAKPEFSKFFADTKGKISNLKGKFSANTAKKAAAKTADNVSEAAENVSDTVNETKKTGIFQKLKNKFPKKAANPEVPNVAETVEQSTETAAQNAAGEISNAEDINKTLEENSKKLDEAAKNSSETVKNVSKVVEDEQETQKAHEDELFKKLFGDGNEKKSIDIPEDNGGIFGWFKRKH